MSKKTTTSKADDLHSIKDCDVLNIGIDGYAECLQNGPNSCCYALPFGYAFLCRHPHIDEMLAKVKQVKSAMAAAQR